jgi:GntR family transcriptional repressor for pyruvate dehydrogenase complex
MIVSGSLAPGDRLPSERTLAEQLAVSRTVVREALRGLAGMNLLDIRQGSGVYVAALDLESLIQPLRFVVDVERSAVEKLAEARAVLEPGLARLAAERARPTDLAPLDEVVLRAQHSVDIPAAFMEADIDFHGEIRRLADNALLTRIMDSLEHLARRGRALTNPHSDMRRRAGADLAEIADAIRRGDPQSADIAMRAHMRHVQETLHDQEGA